MLRSRIASRPALAAAISCLAIGAGGALIAPVASGAKAKAKTTKVTVKVLGKPPAYKVLLNRTVTLTAKPVTKYGGSCTGESAAGALQLATKGAWGGTWDSQYSDYEVTKIAGLSFPFNSKSSADWYWSIWVGGKLASTGLCEIKPKSGETIVFKPACYGKACPKTGKAKSSSLLADSRKRS